MSLQLSVDHEKTNRPIVHMGGQLDAATHGEFDQQLDKLMADLPTGATLVLDLSALDYISSAGLRSLFLARRQMSDRNGRALIVNPQPQIRKVFDIVKAVPVNEIFTSAAELDAYLTEMQQQVLHAGDENQA